MNCEIATPTQTAETTFNGAEVLLSWRMCQSKRCYDRRGARSQINLFARVRGRHGRPEGLRAYSCPFCGGWHLTKRSRQKHELDRSQIIMGTPSIIRLPVRERRRS